MAAAEAPADEEDDPQMSVKDATITLVKSFLEVGILSLPFAFKVRPCPPELDRQKHALAVVLLAPPLTLSPHSISLLLIVSLSSSCSCLLSPALVYHYFSFRVPLISLIISPPLCSLPTLDLACRHLPTTLQCSGVLVGVLGLAVLWALFVHTHGLIVDCR